MSCCGGSCTGCECRNVGLIDRVVRAVIGVAALGVAYVYSSQLVVAVVLALVGVILLATAAMGHCPLYCLLGLNTAGKKPAARPVAARKAPARKRTR